MTELEKAAREYAKCVSERTGEESTNVDDLIAFKDGAEWHAKQSPWISVEDRLPDVGVKVFTKTKNGNYILTSMYIPADCKGNVLGPKEWRGSGAFKGSITHWMPIPE